MGKGGSFVILIALGVVLLMGMMLGVNSIFGNLANKNTLKRISKMEGGYNAEVLAWANYFLALNGPVTRKSAAVDNHYVDSLTLVASSYGGSYVPGTPLNAANTRTFAPESSLVRRYDGSNLHLFSQGAALSCGDQSFGGVSVKACLATVTTSTHPSGGGNCSGIFPIDSFLKAVEAQTPISIQSEADFLAMQNGKNYRVDADFTISPTYIPPLNSGSGGSVLNAYPNLILDGNGHTITLAQPTVLRAGILGGVSNSIIKNITIQGAPGVSVLGMGFINGMAGTCLDNVTVQNLTVFSGTNPTSGGGGAIGPSGRFFLPFELIPEAFSAGGVNASDGWGVAGLVGLADYGPNLQPSVIANSNVKNVTVITPDVVQSVGVPFIGQMTGYSLLVGKVGQDANTYPTPALVIFNSGVQGSVTGHAACGIGFLVGSATQGLIIQNSHGVGSLSSSIYHMGGQNVAGTDISTQNVGGLVGIAASIFSISDSYALTSITGRAYSGIAQGPAGGLVGTAICESMCPSQSCSITRSFSASTVGNVNVVGGLIGQVFNFANGNFALQPTTITNSYWDTTILPNRNVTSSGTVKGGEGWSTQKLQNLSNYQGSDWDMNTVWNPPNGNYPTLRSSPQPPPPIRMPTSYLNPCSG